MGEATTGPSESEIVTVGLEEVAANYQWVYQHRYTKNEIKKLEDDSVKEEHVPRAYQIEMFERAKKSNIIAVMDTGTGKTLIACLLIRHILGLDFAARETGAQKKVVLFLVPTVPLAFQQSDYLKHQISAAVATVTGDLESSSWSMIEWHKLLSENDILCGTPQNFVDALNRGYIKMQQIALLVFDEAHNAVGDHPYAVLMKVHYRPLERTERPKVFGLTASPVNSDTPPNDAIIDLEYILSSTTVTVLRSTDVRRHAACSKTEAVLYDPTSSMIDCPYLSELRDQQQKCLLMHGEMSDLERAIVGEIDRVIVNAQYVLSNLGAWCCQIALIWDIEQVLDHAMKAYVTGIGIENYGGGDLGMMSLMESPRIPNVEPYQELLKKMKHRLPDLKRPRFITNSYEPGGQPQTDGMVLNPDYELTPKVRKLISILKKYRHEQTFCGIIFVQQRSVARLLAELLRTIPELDFLKLNVLMGHGAGKTGSGGKVRGGRGSASATELGAMKMKMTEQYHIVHDFRKGKLNLLVATKVAEEGLDIQSCMLVIRFDMDKSSMNLVNYIQSRGRARARGARFILMCERDNPDHHYHRKSLSDAEIAVRRELEKKTVARKEDDDDGDDDYLMHCRVIPRSYCVDGTKAIVSLYSSQQLLNDFCILLQTEDYYIPQPEYSVLHAAEEKWIASVTLPTLVPAEARFTTGRPMPSKKQAKQDAALEACIKLRKLNLLNEHLRPFRDKTQVRKRTGLNSNVASRKKLKTRLHRILTSMPWLSRPWRRWRRVLPEGGQSDVGTLGSSKGLQQQQQEELNSALQNPTLSSECGYVECYLNVIHLQAIGRDTAEPVPMGLLTAAPLPARSLNFLIWPNVAPVCVHIDASTRPIMVPVQEFAHLKKYHEALIYTMVKLPKSKPTAHGTEPLEPTCMIVPVSLKVLGEVSLSPDCVVKASATAAKAQYHVSHGLELPPPFVNVDAYGTQLVEKLERIGVVSLNSGIDQSNAIEPTSEVAPAAESGSQLSVTTVGPQIMVTREAIRADLLDFATAHSVSTFDPSRYRHLIAQPDFVMTRILTSLKHWGRKFEVLDVLRDASPFDRVSLTVASNTATTNGADQQKNTSTKAAIECYLKKDRAQIKPDHPKGVIRAKLVSRKLNMLAEHNYGEFDQDEGKAGADCTLLIPHFCEVYPVNAATVRTAQVLPSIIYMTELLFIANDVREKLGLGGKRRTSDAEKKERANGIDHAETRSAESNQKDEGEYEEVVTAFEILKAITARSAGLPFSYERLETLGDAFLKVALTLHKWVNFPNLQEGALSILMAREQSNFNLCGKAIHHGLQGYMITEQFSRNTWRPAVFPVVTRAEPKQENPGSADTQSTFEENTRKLSDKQIADVVEAILGACVVCSGVKGGSIALRNIMMCDYLIDWREYLPQVQRAHITAPGQLDALPKERIITVRKVQDLLGYRFKNPALLLEAFTHPSVTDSTVPCYQRLEFLGRMTDLKDASVNNTFLATVAANLGFHYHLHHFSPALQQCIIDFVSILKELQEEHHLKKEGDEGLLTGLASTSSHSSSSKDKGKATEKVTGEKKDKSSDDLFWIDLEPPKAISDVFEATLGAVFVDSGFDVEAVWAVMQRTWLPWVSRYIRPSNVKRHPIRELTDILRRSGCDRWDVRTSFDHEEGKYLSNVIIHKEVMAVAHGPTRKGSRKIAADVAIEFLKSESQNGRKWIKERCDCNKIHRDAAPQTKKMFGLLANVIEAGLTSYRATVFGIKGYLEYTKQGFQNAQKDFTPGALDVDLTGRVAMVTGANSGLGKVTALELAKRGATVHMVCRNEQAGKKALEEIVQSSKNQNVILQIADISRPKQIKELAEKILNDEKAKLHILINNAGALYNERKDTPEGIDASFATNTLGTYYLTTLLVPVLMRSESPRVVTVSSGGMYNKALEIDDLEFRKWSKWDGSLAYAHSKRAQVELTEYWAKKFQGRISFYSMHPGWSDTPGVEKSLPTFHKMLEGKLRTPEEGADTIVWAAVAKEVEEKVPNGAFLFDRKVASTHLPLAFTQAKQGIVDKLVEELDKYISRLIA
ncbi:hypothetical protein HK102_008011 [Quaeritorhiza haematococci]|nr:hypothetical protein HK102_008011 [Quaeritorhiza haematococci]